MKIGLIARADFTGLGVQTYDFYRHMNPDRVLVIDLQHLNGQQNDLSRYPGAKVLHYTPYPDTTQSHPNAIAAFNDFLDGLDLVFTCETPYDYHLFREAQRRGVKTVLQYNFELLDHVLEPNLPRPDLFMAPSLWRYNEVPFGNKVFCPVPVDRSRFIPIIKQRADTFVHVGGTPALEDRNGTVTVIEAWRYVESDAKLIVYTQMGRYTTDHPRVEIRRGTILDQLEFYRAGDVMVMPRKFGGLCLPLNEAMSCALPVVMTDLHPQNDFLPAAALVKAWRARQVMTKMMIDVHETESHVLAARIDELVESPTLVRELSEHNDLMAERISWENLKPVYQRIFEATVAGKIPTQEFAW